MANSRYEYVKQYELDDRLLPGCWVIVRIDGRGFTRFAEAHKWKKPHDMRAIHLMNACAESMMLEFADAVLAIGASDEYSFVLRKTTTMYGRRARANNIRSATSFEGKDEFAFKAWWCGTLSDFKNELLHTQFNINYNELPAVERKGSILLKDRVPVVVKEVEGQSPVVRMRLTVVMLHEDIIGEQFWLEHPDILIC
eukprot:jgi/Chlat1/7151/Chrsp57S06743